MANSRRGNIDRSQMDDDEDVQVTTLAQVDAALYGKLSRIDGGRKAIERLRFGAFKLTPTGLEIGEGAQEKDWEEVGKFIFQLESGIQWLIGDWLAYGIELSYGDMPKIAERFGRDESTLHTYKQMAENIEYTRRRVDLPFSHHQEVRALSPDTQDYALAYAAAKGLKRSDFRKWIKQGMPIEGVVKALPRQKSEPQYQATALWEGIEYIQTRDWSSIPAGMRQAKLDEIQVLRQRLDSAEKWLRQGPDT